MKQIRTIFALICVLLFFASCETTRNHSSNDDFIDNSVDGQKNNVATSHDENVAFETHGMIIKSVTIDEIMGSWVLYTMDDKKDSYQISAEVTIIFDTDDETDGIAFFGNAAVNSYFGSAKINGKKFVTSGIGSTKMAGIEEDMETENNYLRLLNDVNEIGIFYSESETISELVLQNAKTGSTLVFIR